MSARRKFCREVGVAFERVQEMQTLTQQVLDWGTKKTDDQSVSDVSGHVDRGSGLD
jgi:hypothetical protein